MVQTPGIILAKEDLREPSFAQTFDVALSSPDIDPETTIALTSSEGGCSAAAVRVIANIGIPGPLTLAHRFHDATTIVSDIGTPSQPLTHIEGRRIQGHCLSPTSLEGLVLQKGLISAA
jgi:hypothetical protein